MTSISFTLSETPEVAGRILADYGPGHVYALVGPLGAGKTTLVAECCRRLGVTEPTSSPTFSIVNHYMTRQGPVYHLDAYRLRSIEEALEAGLEDIFAEDDATVFVEWPRVLEPLLPPDVVTLHLAHAPGGAARQLSIYSGYAPKQ